MTSHCQCMAVIAIGLDMRPVPVDRSNPHNKYGSAALTLVLAVLRLLSTVNTAVLRTGRWLALSALGLMVTAILAQVFFRYVLNNPLAWPEEAARFLMLWMTGLIAPSAYRWGGFVAIDMLESSLGEQMAKVLQLILLLVSLAVLIVGVGFAWGHTMGFGGNFNSSSLRIPLDLFGGESIRLKLRYMYGSMLFCNIMLLAVNVELLLRSIIQLVKPEHELPQDPDQFMARAD